ncbi:uncharacterized protein LOC141723512 [Apium graveolens]|uniref:uncharacterized protein LOC141723512 n=1 Tax=Apium graveolens TaxID=4045 RepID=UPI003D7BB0F9
MSIKITEVTEREAEDSDQEINPCTMLLLQENEEGKKEAKDELQLYHHQQTFNLQSINSSLVIRQLPSKGLSFQLWPAATAFVSLLDHQYQHSSATLSSLLTRPHSQPLRILELGSGTGMVGIAAAAILGARVTVTDLSHVIPNLKFNVEANLNTVGHNGGGVEVAALGWGVEEEMEAIKEKDEYDVIMGSDVVYHDHLYEPLLQTLKFFLLGEQTKEMVFVMSHLKRWKKESVFFKKAKKDFDVEVIYKHDPCNGSRVGVLLYTFVGKNKKKKVEVAECK